MPPITVLFFQAWKTENLVLFSVDIYSHNNVMKINYYHPEIYTIFINSFDKSQNTIHVQNVSQ